MKLSREQFMQFHEALKGATPRQMARIVSFLERKDTHEDFDIERTVVTDNALCLSVSFRVTVRTGPGESATLVVKEDD